MSTLPNPALATCPSGVYWMPCAGCDALFPIGPGTGPLPALPPGPTAEAVCGGPPGKPFTM